MEPEKSIAGKKILIVDDEKDVLDQLTELLEMCRIDTADSFEAAFAYQFCFSNQIYLSATFSSNLRMSSSLAFSRAIARCDILFFSSAGISANVFLKYGR